MALAGDLTLTSRAPLVIAHRGASALAPENTLAAVLAAVELGVDSVEVDVHMTRDGELVVIHDDTVGRTTNGAGPVGGFDLAGIRRLDAGSWWYRPGARPTWDVSRLRVPTLREVLEAVRGRAGISLELKHPELYPGLERRLIETLEDAGMLEGECSRGVVVQSFSVGCMRLLALLAPQITRFQLTWTDHPATARELDDISRYADGIGPRKESVIPEMVTAAHERGLLVHPYTVNSPAEMRALIEMGVDGIIGDNPVELKRAAREHAIERAA